MKALSIATLVLLTVTAQAQVSPPSNQSRVAGRFVAANYGQWYVNITSAPASTGSQTFAVSSSTIALSDGRQFMPFSTNSPIKVGTETVTPSAVGAGCRLGAASGACVLTATFSSTHTTADTVAPATFGLQEALDDAGSAGGGAVTIDQAWVALGGTTGIKNAATLPSNTGIEDVRTGASSGGGTTTNALTMNNGGSGATSGTTFDGSVARTISYNTLGAAPLASPTFTGTPAAPTAAPGTNTTQLATTAFVQAAAGGGITPEVHTASNSTSLIFTTCLSTSHLNYDIKFTGMVLSASSFDWYVQFSTDGGSTFDTAATNYTQGGRYMQMDGGGGNDYTGAAAINGVDPALNPGANQTTFSDADLTLHNPDTAGSIFGFTSLAALIGSDGRHWHITTGGEYAAGSVNAFRVVAMSARGSSSTVISSGLVSGTVTCQPLQ